MRYGNKVSLRKSAISTYRLSNPLRNLNSSKDLTNTSSVIIKSSSDCFILAYSSIAVTNWSGLMVIYERLKFLRWFFRHFLVILIKKSRWKESIRLILNPERSLLIIYAPVNAIKTICSIITLVLRLSTEIYVSSLHLDLTSDNLIFLKSSKYFSIYFFKEESSTWISTFDINCFIFSYLKWLQGSIDTIKFANISYKASVLICAPCSILVSIELAISETYKLRINYSSLIIVEVRNIIAF